MKALKILGITAVASLTGLGTYFYFYKKKIDKVMDNLVFTFVGIENFSINLINLNADIYIQLHNPTDENLILDSKGYIVIKELRVYEKNKNNLIAVNSINLTEIELMAKGVFNLPKTTISINLLDGLISASSVFLTKTDLMDKLRFEVDVDFLNTKQTITF